MELALLGKTSLWFVSVIKLLNKILIIIKLGVSTTAEGLGRAVGRPYFAHGFFSACYLVNHFFLAV